MIGRWRCTLAARVAVATTAAALVAVVLAGVVSVGLVTGAVASQERVTLGRIADVATGRAGLPARGQLLGGAGVRRGIAGRAATAPTRALLRGTRIAVVRVRPDGQLIGLRRDLVPAAVGTAVAAGQRVDEERSLAGRRYFLEGRPYPVLPGGLVFLQPVSDTSELTTPLLQRLALALLVGLAGAALAGLLLARRLARPLRQAAAAAHRLAGGERQVRLAPGGPAEVAEVAVSLNALAAALAISESRQREFLLSVSHELRTPLTGIQGFAEALADGVTAGLDVPAAGEVILGEARRLERLVSDLLDLARLGAENFRVDPSPVDLAELVSAAAEVWGRRCLGAGVPFSLDLRAAPRLITDAGRVRQILDNLAENALRVVPAGRPIVFGVDVQDGCALLQVRDGGPGLTGDDCAVAFDRAALYERYRGIRRVGTGFGLALVAGLARRLGGGAEAGPAPEGGAQFTVRLPLNRPPDPARDRPPDRPLDPPWPR